MSNEVGPAEIDYAPGYELIIPFDAAYGDPLARPDWSTYTVTAKLRSRDYDLDLPSGQVTVESMPVFETPGTTTGSKISYDIPVITLTAANTAEVRGQAAKLFVEVAASGSEPALQMTATLVEQESPEPL
ncbi:MAG: hypothetical protein AAF141_05590 [Pseudomonadota bacterium]